jgi:tRNA 5-methylaminomethyl-2-thiouridine biosynthesis bifunctional protein
MSKKFPKIKIATHVLESEKNICEGYFDSFAQQSMVIADLCFANGQYFFSQAQQWLQQSLPAEKLYYWALIESPVVYPSFPNHALGQELARKWPPLLYGSFTIDLADGRIQLMVSFGEPVSHLQRVLCIGDLALEKTLRNWSVQRWIVGAEIQDLDLQNLILQLSHSTTQLLSSVEQPWWNGAPQQVSYQIKNAPWVMPKYSNGGEKTKKIMMIGAGLASCYLARQMAESGWHVQVFESEKSCGLIGSGNTYSVLYPKLSAHLAPFTEILHQAYPYAYSTWSELLVLQPTLGRICPLMQEPDVFYQELLPYLQDSPRWFDVSNGQCIFNNSLMLNMPELCHYLLNHENIQIHYGYQVEQLSYANDEWLIGEFSAPKCVIANGYQANQFSHSSYVGVKGMRGQMTHVDEFYQENMIYCKEGHILPAWNGVHAIGASFKNDLDTTPSKADDLNNIEPWQTFFQTNLNPVDCWVGIRGVSLDHIPLVGPIADEQAFCSQFNIWRHHANRVLPYQMPNYPGLFMFSGFGARGLLTIPWLADVLKKMIIGEPMLVSNELLQALSPARFLRKKIVKGVVNHH